VFTRDELPTLVSIYWFTQTAHTAARIYADNSRRPRRPRHERKPSVEAPLGVGVLPHDLLLMPRSVMAADANLAHWTVFPRGGHFGAAEQPELVTEDIRTFFGTLLT
jgi:pimeloyl-ACP methyl ester carboxylesterase